ncbi:MAG TPA: YitT family protein, partial [Erysipelothrix sp.]
IFTTTFAIDKIQFIGGDEAKQVIIITEYIEDVLNIIHLNIDRGSTVLKAQGGYTKEKKDVILTVLYRSQYSQLEKLVKEVDPEAFFIVSDVTEVHGNGFYRV